MPFLFVTVGFLAIVVGAICMRAWVLTVLWSWFLVPYGVPQIAIPAAIGISLIVGMFTTKLSDKWSQEKKKKSLPESFADMISTAFLSPLFVLCIGWVVSGFM